MLYLALLSLLGERPPRWNEGTSRDRRIPEHPHRERRTWRSTEVQAGTRQEWSCFDLGRALLLLIPYNEDVVRRTLRTLHIRWWHVSAEQMPKLLSAAGVPTGTVRLVPDIVDACRVCRAYTRPGPANAATARLVTQFNDVAQHDLLFIEARPTEASAASGRSKETPSRSGQEGGSSASGYVPATGAHLMETPLGAHSWRGIASRRGRRPGEHFPWWPLALTAALLQSILHRAE